MAGVLSTHGPGLITWRTRKHVGLGQRTQTALTTEGRQGKSTWNGCPQGLWESGRSADNKDWGGGFVSVMTQSHVHFTDAGVGGNCPEKIRDMAKVTQQGQGLARDE